MIIHSARIAFAASASLAAVLLAVHPASAQVTVDVNGNALDFSTAPIIQDGRVFVPLRGVFERLGASVDYSNGLITATGSDGRTISLTIGSTQATISGQPETIDVAPFIVSSSTFVPLRFISQALGASVNWDENDHVVSIAMAGASTNDIQYQAPINDNETEYAPPPIPQYDQPYAPAANDIWQPGYWAWGSYGYYWVPGTWVAAPQTGYLWTPGYWGWNSGHYHWNGGYWAAAVGFYGGVNYGAGYFGNGYNGGRWQNGAFHYNTYVSHVNTTIVRNVYVDRTVYINNSTTVRISYNGGPHGVAARPTPQQLAIAHDLHVGMTSAQRQHVLVASQDRRLLANVNHNAPPVLAVARPLSASNPPTAMVRVRPSDRINVPAASAYRAPEARPAAPAYNAEHAAPVTHAAPPARTVPQAAHPAPGYAAPEHAAPAMHAVPPVHAAPVHAAPAYVAPVHPAPVMHAAPPVRPAPAYVAPVHAAPVHVAPVHAAPAYVAPAHVAPARVIPHAAPVRVAPPRAQAKPPGDNDPDHHHQP
jgi:hypothetical protein